MGILDKAKDIAGNVKDAVVDTGAAAIDKTGDAGKFVADKTVDAGSGAKNLGGKVVDKVKDLAD